MLDELARRQAGIVTRKQALAGGLSDEAIAGRLRAGRWQRVHRGIFATFTGPLPRASRMWAALLAAGPEAMLSHETAAELIGLIDRPTGGAVHLSVPHGRQVVAPPGVVVHRVPAPGWARHPAASPPRTRVEDTVIDLTQASRNLDEAVGWLVRAVSGRLTTGPRLAGAMRLRLRLRWRRELSDAVADAADGCHSVLELRYLRTVERAHGLPRAVRQGRRDRWYDDVTYAEFGVVVELDGKSAHRADAVFRDHRRDNAAVLSGRRVLRYGYPDVVERPCVVAREVAEMLAAGGWRSAPRRCGPNCVARAVVAKNT